MKRKNSYLKYLIAAACTAAVLSSCSPQESVEDDNAGLSGRKVVGDGSHSYGTDQEESSDQSPEASPGKEDLSESI